MKVAIITPYYKEPVATLKRCHESVINQTKAATHILVADGFPVKEVEGWAIQHIKLPLAHGDYGDTPRLIGSISAVAQGFDAVCFLDADCSLQKDHVQTLVELHIKTGADIVTATRNLLRPDFSLLGVCTESDGVRFNDTNCYFITRKAFNVLFAWGNKHKDFAVVGDRVFWSEVKRQGFTRAHSLKPTVNYMSLFAQHYLARNEKPPKGAKIVVLPPGENKKYGSFLYEDIKDKWRIRLD